MKLDDMQQEEKQPEIQEAREAMWFGFKWLIGIVVVLGGIGLVFTTIHYLLTPTWNDLQTKGTEHSYTYVQTKKELLYKLMMDYEKLGPEQVGQKKAIVDRMRIEASSMPNEEVPQEVRQFLATH